MQIIAELGIIVLLLALNAFLAASEISLVSARKPHLRALADDGNHAASRVLALAESPSGFLATVQVGITLAGFFAAAVGATRPVTAVPLHALAALVAYSRVHTGVHYPGDVLAGSLLGLALARALTRARA